MNILLNICLVVQCQIIFCINHYSCVPTTLTDIHTFCSTWHLQGCSPVLYLCNYMGSFMLKVCGRCDCVEKQLEKSSPTCTLQSQRAARMYIRVITMRYFLSQKQHLGCISLHSGCIAMFSHTHTKGQGCMTPTAGLGVGGVFWS